MEMFLQQFSTSAIAAYLPEWIEFVAATADVAVVVDFFFTLFQ